MPRYIDAEKIGLRFNGYYDKDDEVFVPLSEVKKAIVTTPTADVQEVKHASWEICGTFDDMLICDACRKMKFPMSTVAMYRFNYCPHCGARMDGE